jgi:hypothetical protein
MYIYTLTTFPLAWRIATFFDNLAKAERREAAIILLKMMETPIYFKLIWLNSEE